MEKKEKKQKYKVDETIECPKCATRIKIKVWDETITPSVPAEKEQHISAEKDVQTTLPRDEETKEDKKEK